MMEKLQRVLKKGRLYMFMFIGNDQVLQTDKIISIIDFQLLKSSTKVMDMMNHKYEQKAVHGNKSDAKSIIVTDHDIYYSPLSILTLKKREELFSTINQLESFYTE